MGELKLIKLVVVGDGAVGKTCLLETYSKGHFPTQYVPTVFDNFNQVCLIDGLDISLSLWDTAGQEEYDRLRLLSYPQTDVVIICFNICYRTSLQNVTYKWLPEIKEHCPNKPIVLVGTQMDRREGEAGKNPVLTSEGQYEAKKLGIAKYLECSALKQEGLKEVFEEACRMVLNPEKTRRTTRKCFIL